MNQQVVISTGQPGTYAWTEMSIEKWFLGTIVLPLARCEQRRRLPCPQKDGLQWWMECDGKTKETGAFKSVALCAGQKERPGKKGTTSEMINSILHKSFLS